MNTQAVAEGGAWCHNDGEEDEAKLEVHFLIK